MPDQPDTKLHYFQDLFTFGPFDIQDHSLQDQQTFQDCMESLAPDNKFMVIRPPGTLLKAEEEDLSESPWKVEEVDDGDALFYPRFIKLESTNFVEPSERTLKNYPALFQWMEPGQAKGCNEEEVRISDLYDKEKEREEAMEEMMEFKVTESTSPDKNGHLLKLVFDNDTDFHFEFSKEIKKKILSRCPPGHKYIYFNLAPREGKDSILSYLRDDEEEQKRFLSTYERLCSEWNFFELFEDGGDKCYFEVWEDEREYFRFLKSGLRLDEEEKNHSLFTYRRLLSEEGTFFKFVEDGENKCHFEITSLMEEMD